MAQRLFIAIDLPEETRHGLLRLVRLPPEGVRPVRPEQIHLTLHFLGDVEEEASTRVVEALRSIRQPAFTFDLAGTGCFPTLRRPTVLWAGVRPSTALASLHAAIGDMLRDCGLPTESRPFAAHVTLARLTPRVPRGWVEEFLEAHSDFAVEGLPATGYTLYSSQRTDNGTVHTPVARYLLS